MWILFALLSPAVYTVTNFVDKYLLSKKVKDHNALPIYTASVSFLFGLVWWCATGFQKLPLFDAGIILLTGVITIFSVVVYFKALSTQETSTVILLFQLSPLFTLLLSALFLKENITLLQYGGFTLILLATCLLALPKKNQSWKLPKGFLLILLYDFLFALIGVLLKFSSSDSTFSQIISYESFGMGIGGVLLFIFNKTVRRAFLKSRKQVFKKALPVIIVNEILFVAAKSFGYYAFVIGPVVLVSVISNVQVFFGLLFGILLSHFLPTHFEEDLAYETIMQKAGAALLLFIGLYFML